nr:unnamed protein product [Digitaria exilis]
MAEQERRDAEAGGDAAAAAVASHASNMQRVKVYRLADGGKWDDQGTGHVSIEYIEGSKELGLTVLDEEDNETLLVHNITSDDIYRKQEETIISWRDHEASTDLALSFQEAAGCSYIWEHICDIQRNLQFSNLGALEVGPRQASESLEASRIMHSNDDSFRSANGEFRELPPVELSNLPFILKTVLEGGITDQIRVAELITQDRDFFPKLVDMFRMCEDLENLDDLHMIFKLVKGIILLNSPSIFDKIFSDEFILDIIGALEYDPEVPRVQRHRAFLKDHVVFKEAIHIENVSVVSKIHQTYRIGYLKDVILPRILDDATLASLNAMIHTNNASVSVISLLKDDALFIRQLFARMRSSDISMESRRELVLFLHEFCTLSKSLPLVQQLRLFRDLSGEGVFDIISDVLQSHDRKIVSAGTDILILFLNQDPNLLRSYIVQQEGNSLLGLLDEHLIRHVVKFNLLKPIIDVFVENGDKYNMLHSGVLELLEYIRKENMKALVIYVIESFWDQLAKFERFGSIQAFKLKYQQYLESAEPRLSASVPDMRKKAEQRGLEKEEEDYFNEDSDEEDSGSGRRAKHAQNQHSKSKVPNGSEADGADGASRPKSAGLVDYDDDDDEDFNPPPKEPARPSEDDVPLNITPVKRKPVNVVDGKHADGEGRKRQKIETRISCAKIAAVTSTSSKHTDLQNKHAPHSPTSSTSSAETNGVLREHGANSEEHQHSVEIAEAPRQTGGDCIKDVGSMSTEKAVNTTNSSDSEPYSVR